MVEAVLEHDETGHQFFMAVDGERAVVDYRLSDGRYVLFHTGVPERLRGQGIGRALVERTLEAIAARGATAVAKCPFVQHVVGLNERWSGIVEMP